MTGSYPRGSRVRILPPAEDLPRPRPVAPAGRRPVIFRIKLPQQDNPSQDNPRGVPESARRARVAAGTVNDPQNKTLHQVDVAVLGRADGSRPPLLAIGQAKWNEQMGLGHLERLRRIRDLLAANAKLDTSGTRLVCFSGAGFTDDLKRRAQRGDVDLVGLADLYDQSA